MNNIEKEIRAIKKALTKGLGSLYLVVRKVESSSENIKEQTTIHKVKIESIEKDIKELSDLFNKLKDDVKPLKDKHIEDKDIRLEKTKNFGKIMALLIPGILALIMQLVGHVTNSRAERNVDQEQRSSQE